MKDTDRVLEMSLELFEKECDNLILSMPADDPLADHDTRLFAERARRLVREYFDFRKKRMTLDDLKEIVRVSKDRAIIILFREAKGAGLLGDPFVDALATALGEISLDEAIAAVHEEARKRNQGS